MRSPLQIEPPEIHYLESSEMRHVSHMAWVLLSPSVSAKCTLSGAKGPLYASPATRVQRCALQVCMAKFSVTVCEPYLLNHGVSCCSLSSTCCGAVFGYGKGILISQISTLVCGCTVSIHHRLSKLSCVYEWLHPCRDSYSARFDI